MKQYIGISRDHSRSMSLLSHDAANDFNNNIKAIQEASKAHSLDTIVSVVKCGVGYKAEVLREVVNSNVQMLKPIAGYDYITDGSGTPLWDSVGELIEILSSSPDADDPQVSFLVMTITDGHENNSKKWTSKTLANKIKQLQATDRWTFVFRVPRGYTSALSQFGIPEGNILEWDQTQRGIEKSTGVTNEAFTNYFANRSQGVKSTQRFYAELKNISIKEVQLQLVDISQDVVIYPVAKADDGVAIKDFIEKKTTFHKGCAFYQLIKSETLQPTKEICIVDKKNGTIYSGLNARQLLGLPSNTDVKLRPGDMGDYQIYVQSTSVNRKLAGDTMVLYISNSAK